MYTEGHGLPFAPISILQHSTLKTIPCVYIEHVVKLKVITKCPQHAVRKVKTLKGWVVGVLIFG